MFDVIVVGAGFAGLAAADQLVAAGRKVCVVEARDRLGGRTAGARLSDGTIVDIGGQWLSPHHDRMIALCRRFEKRIYPMHVAGDNLLLLDRRIRTYRGHLPVRAPLGMLANMGWVLLRLHQLASRISLDAPWESPDASHLDQRTLGDWMRANVRDRHAQSLFRAAVEAVFAADPDELSLLHALFYMRSGKSFDHLTKSEGGAQQDRVEGGLEALADALAADLSARGASVHRSTEVRGVRQAARDVFVDTSAGELAGRRVVLAVPPPLAAEIGFEPALEGSHAELLKRLPMGAVIKCIAAYREPFWRRAGLSGQAVADRGPVHAAFDASPASGRPGLLMGFIEGPAARDLATWEPARRRRVVLDGFCRWFGNEAAEPFDYVDRAWTEERFSRGCYAALFPPGVWTTVGRSIRARDGRVHFAGTETSAVWNGYIEGAVLSGERVASEILSSDV